MLRDCFTLEVNWNLMLLVASYVASFPGPIPGNEAS